MPFLSAAKDFLSKKFPKDKSWHEKPGVRSVVPGSSSIKSFKEKKYGKAAKHLAKDAAYWSTIALPDHGFVTGPIVKHIAHKALFRGGDDSESGRKVRKIKEAIYEYRINNLKH